MDPRLNGQLRFVADIQCANALHCAFVFSTEPHARILAIDTSIAMSIPGVVTVLTGNDIGDRRFGRSVRDYPILAIDRVLFVGQRIAAVAAKDAVTARAAASEVLVEYEPLEVVSDLHAATRGDAISLHPEYETYSGALESRKHANMQGEENVVLGNAKRSTMFSECDEVYCHTFRWSRSHSAPLETHSCLIAAGDKVNVYSTHKEPYNLCRDLAIMSGRSEDEFAVHPVPIGGDFGAKGSPFLEGACYFLAEATGKPVRCSMSYTEELSTTGARHPGELELRTGLKDGTIHACSARSVLDGGAFAALKPRPTHTVRVVGVPFAAYSVPNRREVSTTVYTNSLPGAHVRAPGEFQAVFAGESHVDIIARRRGEDPLSFRMRHVNDPTVRQILESMRDVIAKWGDSTNDYTGTGVAIFHRGSGPGRSTVQCDATADGVTLAVGVPDQGAGSYQAFRLLLARHLQIPESYITVQPMGADPRLSDSGAGASRVTSIAGRACLRAGEALLRELGKPPPYGPDTYWIAGRLWNMGRRSISALGTCDVGRGSPDQTASIAHGGLAVRLSVDIGTGQFKLERAAMAISAGEIVNPVGHRGQLEGGFVYGLSQALFEDLRIENGQVVSGTLADYKIASSADVPTLDIRVLSGGDKEEGGPIRAIGELANIGVAPAIANAIDDAVDVRILELPITAERVWQALSTEESINAN